MKLIKIIIGSVRDGRAGEKVAAWVLNSAERYAGNLKFEMIDLKDIDLPFMNEPKSPKSGKDYFYEHTRIWSNIIDEADGFIFVTPEYNHGYSGVLKNALDYLYYEWKGKPAGLVGYGFRGASNSIRQLKEVFEIIRIKPIETQVGIHRISEAFNEDGTLKPENIKGEINELFNELDSVLNITSN
jgi:NAD(P)H-dependent FMN reductase